MAKETIRNAPAATKWSRKVGAVFNVRPRIGRGQTVWLEREEASERLDKALDRPGVHVCLDGPSGAGKTSLALTRLFAREAKHVVVMVTAEMTWPEFCRLLIGTPTNDEATLSRDMEFGIDKGLPVVKLRVSFGEKGRPVDDVTLAEKLANIWTEHDVARKLVELNAILVVDDLEQASEPLLKRIAALCKLMTQSYVAEDSKLVLIGAADIYRRIHSLHHALDERVAQVSLGAFARPDDARLFLTMGFRALKLWHPWNSYYKKQKEKQAECAESIWEAADGLPKSLNSLGYDVALAAEGRSSITAGILIDEGRRITDDHCAQYSRDFPHVLQMLETNPIAVSLVRRLYDEGIARIHRIPTIVEYLHRHGEDIPSDDINSALDELVRIEFLVRTGKRGELVFAQNPTAAHTLGVVLRNPGRFEALAEMARRNPLQMRLPLFFDGGTNVADRPSREA